jgi:hypothetical protein
MKSLAVILMALLASCDNGKPALAPPTSDLGTGLNTVERRYLRPVPEVLKAATAALNGLGLRIDSEKSDALGGDIAAHRATDAKILLTVKSVDASTSSVSVRVDPGDRNMSKVIHEKIAAGLGLAEASAEGEVFTKLYSDSLAVSVSAAEKALKSLNQDLVERRSGDADVLLQARGEDSIPSSFRIRKMTDGRTEVTITSGSAKGSPYRERRDALKSAFEKALPGGSGS